MISFKNNPSIYREALLTASYQKSRVKVNQIRREEGE